ncbi:MAG: chemotaxis protein [Siculibacillus sp.]
MTTPAQVTPLAIEDYDAIEAAVMETQRGRWFLAEYARRNRNSDTDQVLTALERIERTIRRERAAPDIDRIRLDLADMAEAISRTKQEIAQMKLDTEHGGRFADASHELDAIVGQTETATNEILLAAEGIQEAAWTLREAGASSDTCDALDAHATEIYTACSFQDLTGQRTRKVVTVLRYLESRIGAMMDIWGLGNEELEISDVDGRFDPMDFRPDAHLLNGPQLAGRGIGQNTVDELMWTDSAWDVDAVPAIEVSAEPPAPAPDVFATAELAVAEADVFATGDDAFPTASVAPEEEDEPLAFTTTTTTVAVGNTVMTVAAEAMAEAAPTPALSVVESIDPIASLEPRERLVTFG